MDDALRHVGGFSKFQLRACTVYQLLISCGSFSLYPLMYYELIPAFECRPKGTAYGGWYECTKEDFCGVENIEYRIDYTK